MSPSTSHMPDILTHVSWSMVRPLPAASWANHACRVVVVAARPWAGLDAFESIPSLEEVKTLTRGVNISFPGNCPGSLRSCLGCLHSPLTHLPVPAPCCPRTALGCSVFLEHGMGHSDFVALHTYPPQHTQGGEHRPPSGWLHGCPGGSQHGNLPSCSLQTGERECLSRPTAAQAQPRELGGFLEVAV